MPFRIGIHLGDIMVQGAKIYGDGVNVAARLEGLAEPGGVCMSDLVYQQVRRRLDLPATDLGEQELKNIEEVASPLLSKIYFDKKDASLVVLFGRAGIDFSLAQAKIAQMTDAEAGLAAQRDHPHPEPFTHKVVRREPVRQMTRCSPILLKPPLA